MARLGERRGAYRVWKSEGERNFEDLGIDGRTILKWILQKWDRGMHCINLAGDGTGGGLDCICTVHVIRSLNC